MAYPKDQGMTALEAVDRFCTYWTWAGTFSDDPKEREQAFRAAASELGAMLRHEIPDQPPCTTKQVTPQGDRVRRRAKKALKGQKKPGPRKRKQAVFNAMMTARQNPDQSLVPLWATGHKVGADPNAHPKLIATDMWFFKRCGRVKVDIEANAAAGDGLKYVGLRFYDAAPAQAVASTASVFIKKGGAGSAAEPPEMEQNAPQADDTGSSTPTDIEAEYAERVNEHRAKTGRRPTFQADNEWRKSKGLKRDTLRDLRQQHRTEEERKGGHPPRS